MSKLKEFAQALKRNPLEVLRITQKDNSNRRAAHAAALAQPIVKKVVKKVAPVQVQEQPMIESDEAWNKRMAILDAIGNSRPLMNQTKIFSKLHKNIDIMDSLTALFEKTGKEVNEGNISKAIDTLNKSNGDINKAIQLVDRSTDLNATITPSFTEEGSIDLDNVAEEGNAQKVQINTLRPTLMADVKRQPENTLQVRPNTAVAGQQRIAKDGHKTGGRS